MLQANQTISDQDIRTTSSVQGATQLGQYNQAVDGRMFRYFQNGAVTLVAGNLVIAQATTANHVGRTGTANAAGVTTVSFVLGATLATQDQYVGGYLAVGAVGQNMYRIAGNTAAISGGTITVYLDDPLTVATTTGSTFSLLPAQYSGVIASTGAVAFQALGVPNVPVTAAFFGWAQVTGYAMVLNDATPITKGAGAITSAATAGAVSIEVAASVTQRVGYAPEATTASVYNPIALTLSI